MRHAFVAALLLIGCGSSEDPPASQGDTGVADTGDVGGDTFVPDPALAVPCTDTEAAVFGAPGMLPSEKGAIIKCFQGRKISKEDLQAQANKNGYTGKPFTSGAKIFKITYRTERGDTANTPGYSSAIVYLPDAPRAAKSPLMLVAHGSRGQMGKCAPGNPPPGYAAALDVGKSMLDGTRAFKKLAPSVIDDNVVVIGHSQGGHTALATLAVSESYGLAGKISAAVTFAPLWLPQRSWGALLLLPSMFNFTDYRAANAVSIWYHYTHGELLDGQGKGGDVFKPEKRAQIKQFVDTVCWAETYPLLDAMGKDPSDIFETNFADAIGGASGAGSACPTDEPKKSLCEKWMKRYLDDRPHLTGNAAKIPILFLYGNKDTTIPPERVTCARDRLKTDMAAVEWCVETEADHGGIVKVRQSYAIDWLLSKTVGTPAPAPCAKGEMDIPGTCNTVPPND